MNPGFTPSYDSGGHAYSCDALDSGLYYTSAYYEEDQIYCENLETSYESCDNQKTKCNVENAPVKIQEHCATVIDLPPIEWHGYKTAPKILSITNTGRTILINGQWIKARPYIGGGPLNGNYMFSQIHFHSPSEHEVGGKRYPLEMHVVHYKTSYLTQERAMRERDGTVVLVYLFQVTDSDQTSLSFVTKLTSEIETANSRSETTDVSLDQIVKPFSSNYYIYWGSVTTEKNSYLLQWLINCHVLYVNRQEANQLLNVLNLNGVTAEAPRMKPENDAIFYVEGAEVEEKEENDHCKTCHIYQEWWMNHYSGGCCTNTCTENSGIENNSSENKQQEDKCSSCSDMKKDVCQKVEECPPRPRPVTCKGRKSYSGLRMCCCHKKRKRTPCCNRTVSLCSCKPPSETSINYEEKKCKTKKKYCFKAHEISSCPSVSMDVETHVSEELICDEKKEVKTVSSVCSCPSINKCSSSHVCDEAKKKKKKKPESCEVMESSSKQCIVVSTTKKKMDCNFENKHLSCKKSGSRKKLKKRSCLKKSKKKKECDECESVCESLCKSVCEPVCQPVCKPVCEPVCDIESVCTSSKSSTSVRKKKSSKSIDECEPICDIESSCTSSKSSTSVKKVKKKSKSKKNVPVECMFAAVPDKSFEEILSEYDTTWLVDSKLKMSKTDSKSSDESLETDKSKSKESFKLKASSDECRDTITTIYEKKRAPKPPVHVEDCTVSFLLTPNDQQINPSVSTMSPNSISEEINGVQKLESNLPSNVQNLSGFKLFNPSNSGVKQSTEKANESPKELCVQVELSINSGKKDFSDCISQEYNFALMYNHNILQEYKGIFRPDKIHLGNYEKLELVPKYPDPDGISIRVQDCIIKMESLDKLSMRAKFLLKEIKCNCLPNIVGLDGNPEKKIQMLCDAITQCSVRKFIKPNEAEMQVLKINDSNERMSAIEQEKETNEKAELPPGILNVEKSPKDAESFEQIFLKDGVLEDEECKVKIVKNPVSDMSESSKELLDSSEQLFEVKDCKEERIKDLNKTSVKEVKHLLPSKKKTVYFMYEKIEKDENSGKKILIGNFRSKEGFLGFTGIQQRMNQKPPRSIIPPVEMSFFLDVSLKTVLLLLFLKKVESLSKEKKQNSGSIDTIENNEYNKVIVQPEDTENPDKIEQEVKVHIPINAKNIVNDEKDVITLHKLKSKRLGVNIPKKERLKLVVGRVLNQLERDSRSFRRLADLVGVTKKGNSKISVYELQHPSENTSESTSLCATGNENQHIAESKTQAYALAPEISLKKTCMSEAAGCVSPADENQKPLNKKASQSAVIVIPVEVESLSKVEVILVEHSDGRSKNSAAKNEKEIIPCLNYSS